MIARLAVVILLVVAACSAGPDAPPVGAPETVCTGNFCVDYPSDWEVVEVGVDFAVFRHPSGEDEVIASVGQVNMELLATEGGRSWPQTTDEVVRAFWQLLASEDAELGALRLLVDGSVSSFGALKGGWLWHRLVPIGASRAVGVEIRGPNRSWEDHADVFIEGLTVVFDG